MNFKFQSDSINTCTAFNTISTHNTPLNSNLILLIHSDKIDVDKLVYTLNSNLILLIPSSWSGSGSGGVVFKFQSDSINTLTLYDAKTILYCFKFQSDSINTLLLNTKSVCLVLL